MAPGHMRPAGATASGRRTMGCFGCFEGLFRTRPPTLPKGRITLKYFPFTGRAEPIRLALRIGGIEFEDQRITSSEWIATEKQRTPYGQMPVLVFEQTKIAQTKAILRYLGKLIRHNGHLLYPEDPLVAAKVDEVLDAFDDVWVLLAPTYRITDKEQKEIARQTLFGPGGDAAAIIGMIENMLKQSSNGFLVPEARGLTVADLAYFCFLSTIRSGFIDGLTPKLFSDCPEIIKHKEKVASIPAIADYYADPKRSNPGNFPIYEVFKPGR